ncbi:MAG: hypothetical protein AAGI38_24775, partial [Bacteroidota bacterium]
KRLVKNLGMYSIMCPGISKFQRYSRTSFLMKMGVFPFPVNWEKRVKELRTRNHLHRKQGFCVGIAYVGLKRNLIFRENWNSRTSFNASLKNFDLNTME